MGVDRVPPPSSGQKRLRGWWGDRLFYKNRKNFSEKTGFSPKNLF